MRVIICDFTGQLPRAGRQELETRLAALVGTTPAVDTVELDLESPKGTPALSPKRVSLTLRANHRPVVRVTGEAPTLTAALEQAVSHAARNRHLPGTAVAGPRTRALQ